MLEDLKELDKFLKLCRKRGVTDITFAGASVKFGELPNEVKEGQSEDSDEIPTDEPSLEELIFHAVDHAGQI